MIFDFFRDSIANVRPEMIIEISEGQKNFSTILNHWQKKTSQRHLKKTL
jgi:hypothetical protein